MAGAQFTGAQCFQTPVSVSRGRGLLGVPLSFPELSSSVGSAEGMAAHASGLLVGDLRTYHTQQSSPSTHQGPCTSTSVNTVDILGQMGDMVQHIGQQLEDSILAHLSWLSPVASLSVPSAHSGSHTPVHDYGKFLISASRSESEKTDISLLLEVTIQILLHWKSGLRSRRLSLGGEAYLLRSKVKRSSSI